MKDSINLKENNHTKSEKKKKLKEKNLIEKVNNHEMEHTQKSKKRKLKENGTTFIEGIMDKSKSKNDLPAANKKLKTERNIRKLNVDKRKKKKIKKKLKLASSSQANETKDSSKMGKPAYILSDAPDAIAERHRLKHEKKAQRTGDDDVWAQRALRYLETYQNDRSSWKFRKNLNIFLLKHQLNSTRIPDSHFPMLLEYFRNAKGNAITSIKDVATGCLNKKDDESKEAKKIRIRAQKIVSLFD